MSNTLTIGGAITLVSGNTRTVLSLTDSLTTTGSNYVLNNANVNTGSWQMLTQGSNSDYRYGFFINTDSVSSVLIAIGSSATGSYSAYLNPGDVAIIPNHAGNSVPIFAYATGSNSPAVLNYLVSEQ